MTIAITLDACSHAIPAMQEAAARIAELVLVAKSRRAKRQVTPHVGIGAAHRQCVGRSADLEVTCANAHFRESR
jgi:hypothetical protein